MEREVGGGIGMGNTCKHMAVLLQCMTKFTTKKKKQQSIITYIVKSHFFLFIFCPISTLTSPTVSLLSLQSFFRREEM